jgi:O-antigen/teichoic acid export membrane protein
MSQESKSTFFKQSGWMVIATVSGGVFMMTVHTVVNTIPDYAVFVTLLRCLILLGIPAAGLQTIFAQQSAGSTGEDQERQLARTMRSVLAAIFIVWLALFAAVFFFRSTILTKLKIEDPTALWMTMAVVLTGLLQPIVRGVLQGKQNFSAFGWMAIFDGIGRFAATFVIVKLLGGHTAGAMTAACLGQFGSLVVGFLATRKLLFMPGAKFDWRPWINKVVPFTLGAGGLLFLQNTDIIYVQSVFTKEQADVYVSAAMIAFAIVQFTGPIAVVMFPKVARSAARAEKTDALKLTLMSTGAIGFAAALVCTVLPKLPLMILYFNNKARWEATPIVPWFGWTVLFMILSNVLVGNLLARGKFQIIWWMVLLGLCYAATLGMIKPHLLQMEMYAGFTRLIQVLGIVSALLTLVAGWLTWKK